MVCIALAIFSGLVGIGCLSAALFVGSESGFWLDDTKYSVLLWVGVASVATAVCMGLALLCLRRIARRFAANAGGNDFDTSSCGTDTPRRFVCEYGEAVGIEFAESGFRFVAPADAIAVFGGDYETVHPYADCEFRILRQYPEFGALPVYALDITYGEDTDGEPCHVGILLDKALLYTLSRFGIEPKGEETLADAQEPFESRRKVRVFRYGRIPHYLKFLLMLLSCCAGAAVGIGIALGAGAVEIGIGVGAVIAVVPCILLMSEWGEPSKLIFYTDCVRTDRDSILRFDEITAAKVTTGACGERTKDFLLLETDADTLLFPMSLAIGKYLMTVLDESLLRDEEESASAETGSADGESTVGKHTDDTADGQNGQE